MHARTHPPTHTSTHTHANTHTHTHTHARTHQVMRRIAAGDMVAPGAMAALLAVERLREMGLR